MAKTKIEDVYVPDVWERTIIERTAKKANFGNSGLVERSAEYDALVSGAGRMANMPFWKDLSGKRQLISDEDPLSTRKITSSKDEARIHNDANSWSTTLLAGLLSGEDPMAAIEELVAEYWARVDEDMLIATINGVIASFDAEQGSPNILKIAAEAAAEVDEDSVLTDLTFLDAVQKLGDVKDLLTAIAVHSKTENDLSKQNQIDVIQPSEGSALIRVFKGLQVIMDDSMPVRKGSGAGSPDILASVLFGRGAVARGFASLNTPLRNGFGTDAVELSRVSLNHDDVLINRRRHIMHTRGVAWSDKTSTIADAGPSDEELEEAENWNRVFEAKNIRIVAVIHNLADSIQVDTGGGGD